MAKTIIHCAGCGELILRPFNENGINRCPACGRMMSLNVVDLSDRPDILRRLRAVQQEPPLKSKVTKP